jgi:hypothetical protein
MRWSLIALLLLGCGDSGELAALKSSLANAQESIVETQATQIDKTDEAIGILKDNTTALAAIKASIDALPVVSKAANSEEVIKSAPNPPAKANTQQTPLKVATPGDFSQETLVELATRLYARGVNTHMKTEEQLKAIDAQLNGGAPVTGAIFQNQRTSAVTSQRTSVRLVPRGKGVVRWQRNTSGQTCGPNGCY